MRISHTKEKGQRREGEQKVDSPVNLPTDPAVSQSQTAKAANIYFRLKSAATVLPGFSPSLGLVVDTLGM